MINIGLFGPPGVGKGTQSRLLQQQYKLQPIAPGEIFRAEIKQQTPLGMRLQSYINRGHLAPEELTLQVIRDVLDRTPAAQYFLFDGFPRTVTQAEALDQELAARQLKLDVVFFLEASYAELHKRMAHRARLLGRADDQSPALIQQRLAVYETATLPVSQYYQARNQLISIPGEGSISEVNQRIQAAIQPFLPANPQA